MGATTPEMEKLLRELTYLHRMTDEVGLVQHAVYTLPRRDEGYATDDNARALVAATRSFNKFEEQTTLRLAETYLSFLHHAIGVNGKFLAFMGYDRRWTKSRLIDDTQGRSLWAAAEAESSRLPEPMRKLALEIFERGSNAMDKVKGPRGLAFRLIAIDSLKQDQKRRYIGSCIAAADALVEMFEEHSDGNWQWFEDEMTYANARLPHGLLCAYRTTGRERYLEVAELSLRFLDRITVRDGVFVPIGNQGWASRGGERALYDQQPVEAGTTVEAASLAYAVTAREEYRSAATRAFEWFGGRNTLGRALVDLSEGSCCDGLKADGVNENRGAEAAVSFLLAAQCMAGMIEHRSEPEARAIPREGNPTA